MGGNVREPGTNASSDAKGSLWLSLMALPGVFRLASTEWVGDNVPRLGAALAFYILLSLAPIVVLAVAVAAIVYGQDAAQGRLASEIQGMAGPDAARTIQELVRDACQPGTGAIASLLGVGTLAVGASSVFVELHDAMNTIWGALFPRDRSNTATMIRLIRDRFYSFAAVLGTGFLLLASLILNAWIAAVRIAVPRGAAFVILYLMIGTLFAVLYKIVPDVKLKWSDVAFGAAVTSLLFVIGKQLMGLYIARTGLGSTYGAAASPIIVLLWIYYSAQLFFWGAEFTKAYAKTLGSQRDREY